MILDPIIPEIYTFLDFIKHGCFLAKKKGENSYQTHLGGDIPKEHPMPYNVYVPIREFFLQQPNAIDATVKYLEEEFKKPNYDFKHIEVSASICNVRKGFGRSKSYPQIDITVEW